MLKQSDKKLIILAKKDSKYFSVLYKKYYDKVYRYFWYRAGFHKEVTEDLSQEVFLKAFSNLSSFQLTTKSYYGYLKTIAHNLLINYYKKKKEIPLDEIREDLIEHTENIEEYDFKRVWMELEALSKDEKLAILLKYQDELNVEEISSKMKKSKNAVKLLLSRARKKLSKFKNIIELVGNKKFNQRPGSQSESQ